MIYVSNEFKQAFLSAEQKKLVLTFDDGTIIDNDDIAMESMELEQTLCDSEELRFGKVASACFKTKIKASTKRYKNLWFNAKISVGEHEIALGRFKVYTDNMTSDRLYREIVSYDALFLAINTDVTEWYNGLTFPITQKALRNSLFEYLGIEQEEVALPNDSITFNRTADVENLTGLTVLQKLCELNATWGTINNNGKFKYVRMRTHELDSLYPSDDLYPSDNLYPNDIYDDRLSKASYFQGSLKYEEYDTQPISKVTIREEPDDLGYSYGTDGNTYVIQGNFLMYGASDEVLGQVAKNFFDYAQYISYTPSELKCKGAPWREVGDLLFVVADKRTLAVPILNRKLSGITALKDNYIAKGTETYGEVKNSTTEQIKQLQSRTNKLTRTLDETRSEISKIETDLEDNYSTTKEMNSAISQTAESITSTVARNENKWNVDYETYTVDLFGFGAPSNDTAGSNVGKYYLDQESGSLYTTIKNDENRYVWTEVAQFESIQSDMYSKIEQNAFGIKQRVVKGEVVSEINQSEDTIELKGNRIIVDSTKWKVNENGSQECSDLKITGGSIDLEEGEVQGYVRVAYGGYATTVFAGDMSTNSPSGTVALYADGMILVNANYGTGGNVFYLADHQCWIGSDNVIVTNNFSVKGTKSRLSETKDYGERLLYCYETTSPMFGDLGEGKIDETGKCYIFLDDIFGETIDADCLYQVFLQPYGKGECYVTERTSSYFIVEGTEKLLFGWELKAIQRDFDTIRMEEHELKDEEKTDVLSETYGYLTTLLYNPETEEIENE